MRRRLSALLVAVVIVCGVLGGAIPKPAIAGVFGSEVLTPMIVRKSGFLPNPKNIIIGNYANVRNRHFLIPNRRHFGLRKRATAGDVNVDSFGGRNSHIGFTKRKLHNQGIGVQVDRGRAKEYDRLNSHIPGWGLPIIPQIHRNGNLTVLIMFENAFRLTGHVSSKLDFRSAPILPQIFNQSYERARRQSGLQNHRPKHPVSENRHRLLRGEIALLALIGITGLGLGYRAFNKAVDAGNVSKAVAWAVCWIVLTAIGAYGLIVAIIRSMN